MTLERIRTQAKRYGRATGVSDDQVNQLINEAVKEFAAEVHGFEKHDYITLGAKFDIRTNMAIRVTITGGTNALSATDVVITSLNRTGVAGADVASELQSKLNTAIDTGDVVVSWVSSYKFRIDTTATSSSTAITIAAPSDVTYADARDLLGLDGTLTESSTGKFDGDYPTDCLVEADLPDDFMGIEKVEWEGDELRPTTRSWVISPETTGTPGWYQVRGDKIRVYPSPDFQETFRIEYKGSGQDPIRPAYQELGLSGVVTDGASGLTAATQYYWKVAIDGAAAVEYDLTTGDDLTWDAVVDLMNTEMTGAKAKIYGGDIRVVSATTGTSSAIAVTAGTTGTDLLTTISASADSAVTSQEDYTLSDIPDTYHFAFVHLVATMLMSEEWDEEYSRSFAFYQRGLKRYRQARGNKDTLLSQPAYTNPTWFRVTST